MKNIKIMLLMTLSILMVTGCKKEVTPDNTSTQSTTKTQVTIVEKDTPTEMDEEVNEEASEEAIEKEDGVTTFSLSGKNYRFVLNGSETPDLRVKMGDKVQIKFISTEGYHDWVVDEFDAATDKVEEGDSTSVEFVADQAGTFEYYCSVSQHRADGMRGNLIVE